MDGKRVAIVQSNYIPWKGYFDLIATVDEFILFDTVQFTRRDWRNRNRIKSSRGVRWLTIPVKTRGRYHQRIDETEVSDPGWARGHWSAIAQAYADAACFARCAPQLEELYAGADESLLTHVNERFLRGISGLLGIQTPISRAEDGPPEADPTQRLVWLCQRAGASEYVCGPASRAYLDEAAFARAGISVAYMDYGGYPAYPQLHPPFEHRVSIVDLLLNTGPDAARYMKHVPRDALARS